MFRAAKHLCLILLAPACVHAADLAAKADHLDYYAALSYYSEAAYRAAPGSEDYMEAYAAGNYLREKVDALEARFLAAGEQPPLPDREKEAAGPSERVRAELRDVFGFGGGQDRQEPVIIKPGFAKIVYVKGDTPFLVQSDAFLKKGEVILTYDDGPAPGAYSVEAAENLRENSASAVFFVLGSKLGQQGRGVIRSVADMGHRVAVHGYHHATPDGKPFTAYGTEKILSQLAGVAETITSAAGAEPGLFRPPYGIISPVSLKAITSDLDLVPLGWTIDTLDWSIKSPDELFEKTTAMIQERGKGIVLMHDVHAQSREVSKRLLVWLKENGYTVVSPDRITKAFKAP